MKNLGANLNRPPRHLEWWLARFTCAYGLWIILMPSSMVSPGYATVRQWMEPISWGTLALTVGSLHLAALTANGRWTWSPLIRSGAAALNALFFAVIGTGFAKADANSIGVAIYLFGLSWAGFVAFSTACRDSVRLLCEKRPRRS